MSFVSAGGQKAACEGRYAQCSDGDAARATQLHVPDKKAPSLGCGQGVTSSVSSPLRSTTSRRRQPRTLAAEALPLKSSTSTARTTRESIVANVSPNTCVTAGRGVAAVAVQQRRGRSSGCATHVKRQRR